MAESPGLPHLLRFVLEQGSDDVLSIMQPLFTFHEKLINPRTRKLKEHHFKDVCVIDCPWLRLVMLQSAYAAKREKIRDCWIESFGTPLCTKIMKPDLKIFRGDMSFILKKFHREYAALAAYDHFKDGQQHKFLGRLGMSLGKILMKAAEDPVEARSEMMAAVWAFEQELRKDLSEEMSQKMGAPMGRAPQAPPKAPAQAGKNPAKQAPEKRMMLVSYDEQGNALRTEGAALAAGSPNIEVLSLTATDKRQESLREVAKAKLFEAIHVCARADSALSSLEKAQAEGDASNQKTVRVFCKSEAPAGTLMFLPLVPTVSSITEQSNHPHKVMCEVQDFGGPHGHCTLRPPPASGCCAGGSPQGQGERLGGAFLAHPQVLCAGGV